MTTNQYQFRMDGRPADRAWKALGDLRVAARTAGATVAGAVIDEAQRLDRVHPRSSNLPSPHSMTNGWTTAHSAAARFLGECFAAGALLGICTEMARPRWEKRHG